MALKRKRNKKGALVKTAERQKKLNRFNDRWRKIQDKTALAFYQQYLEKVMDLAGNVSFGKKYVRLNMRELKKGRSGDELDALLDTLLTLDTQGNYKEKTQALRDDFVDLWEEEDLWQAKKEIDDFFGAHQEEITFNSAFMDEYGLEIMHIRGRRKTYQELHEAMKHYNVLFEEERNNADIDIRGVKV